jgi:site-specific DNA-methyltransferase (adenine-specific)
VPNTTDCQLHCGDCLDILPTIPDASVDMVLCDLPYGTTACKWDSVIPFEPLWREYRRVTKANAAIVLTASQPFTSALVMSNVRWFRYEWIWRKTVKSGPLNAKRRPLCEHESVLVFAQGQTTYKPQGLREGRSSGGKYSRTECYGQMSGVNEQTHTGCLHPTQKPVALMEYLIRTYTNEGDTVLDNCMGSGTTGLACANTGRKFIGIEREPSYFAIAQERILNQPLRLAV